MRVQTIKFIAVLAIAGLVAAACSKKESSSNQEATTENESAGVVEVLDEEVTKLIDPSASLEVLGEGYKWSEGPLWVEEHQFLLFSDVQTNTIHKWTEEEGVTTYLQPSGYTGEVERGGFLGSNGLFINNDGHLLICQHGDHRIARMDAPLDDPAPEFTTLADSYNGQRLHSPNDLVQHSNGDIYFTDPPYGYEAGPDAPERELSPNGVYRLTTEGEVILLTDELSRPNGIDLSPDEKTLYVSNSTAENPIWMAYDVTENGNISNGRVFHDASEFAGKVPGNQDGFDVDADGNIYATGPGGIWIFAPNGSVLGKIKSGHSTNCTIGNNGNILFITAEDQLLSIPLR